MNHLANISTPRATILIPAYNEAAVIGETLRRLTAEMIGGEFELIVICNACHDETANVAAKAAPSATILETETPGKTNAVRLGLKMASAPIKVFLDADLGVDAAAIRKLIAPLETGEALASHGDMTVNLTGCSALVRGFYAVWALNPYLQNGKFGGLFALSGAGCQHVSPLPDVTADDEYISRAFQNDEKAFVRDVIFEVRAPRTLGDLMKIRRRSLRGTRELAALGLPTERPVGAQSGRTILAHLATRPTLWPAALIYFAMMLAVRISLALESPNTAPRWERDNSSRLAIVN